MEITPEIDKLLKSESYEDKEIALELLKHGGYTKFDEFTYAYRFRFDLQSMDPYFDYTLTDEMKPCLGFDGKTLYGTRVRILKFK